MSNQDPIESQKLANERTDHVGRPKQPAVPRESFEERREGTDVERPREGVERERP